MQIWCILLVHSLYFQGLLLLSEEEKMSNNFEHKSIAHVRFCWMYRGEQLKLFHSIVPEAGTSRSHLSLWYVAVRVTWYSNFTSGFLFLPLHTQKKLSWFVVCGREVVGSVSGTCINFYDPFMCCCCCDDHVARGSRRVMSLKVWESRISGNFNFNYVSKCILL